MFIETHKDGDLTLTFIKSANVQAFPCGRRRSSFINYDANNDGNTGPNEGSYIPFDPEARLNTEANNRKHSGLNGFTQTYLKDWDTSERAEGDSAKKLLTLSLAGYLFTITLPMFSIETEGSEPLSLDARVPNDFGRGVIETLRAKIESLIKIAEGKSVTDKQNLESELELVDTADKIYANIRIEDVHLFSGDRQEYYTRVLRDQSASVYPETSLDLLNTETASMTSDDRLNEMKKFENYYFSGLSFSTTPLVKTAVSGSYTPVTRDSKIKEVVRDGFPEDKVTQQIVSLCILEKVKTSAAGVTPEVWEWKIHEPARLPLVEHDILEDSVVMGETHVREKLTVDKDAEVKQKLTVKADAEITATTTTTYLNVTTKATIKEEAVETADIETADINTLTGTNATYTTVEGTTLVKGEELLQNGYKVPTIELIESGNEWQLKITKIGAKG